MNAIQKAIEVLQGCLEHPGADDAIAGLRAMMVQQFNTVPPFSSIATRKLSDLIAGGWAIGGVHIQRTDGDNITHGAVTAGGQVLWWHAQPEPAHTARRVPLTTEQRNAIEKANTTEGYHGDYYDAFGIIDDVEAAHGITKETP